MNLASKLAPLDAPFTPGIVGRVAQARRHGRLLVLRGRLTLQLRDRDVELSEGEL
jgi:quercetin dioxygenase-like cupin family protein